MLKDVLARLPANARLAFVGDGPARADLEAHFQGTRTHFTGMLRGADLHAAYASADIFVIPSPTETLGFVALEAMASGLPAICAAAGGLVDIVTRPGEVGFLCPPDDVGAWAGVAATLVASSAERDRVGSAARAYVEGKGWAPAVAVVRDRQYRRAVRAHAARKGLKARARRDALALVGRALVGLLVLAALAWALFFRGGAGSGGVDRVAAAPAPPSAAPRVAQGLMW
jgi:sulfoquinovosyltransferase